VVDHLGVEQLREHRLAAVGLVLVDEPPYDLLVVHRSSSVAEPSIPPAGGGAHR
jgi:hypothetical protein